MISILHDLYRRAEVDGLSTTRGCIAPPRSEIDTIALASLSCCEIGSTSGTRSTSHSLRIYASSIANVILDCVSVSNYLLPIPGATHRGGGEKEEEQIRQRRRRGGRSGRRGRGATDTFERKRKTRRRRRTTHPRTARYPSHALLGIDAVVDGRQWP